MGRHKDREIWKHFSQAPNKSVKCRFCHKSYNFPNVCKMRAHLQICIKCPLDIRQELNLNLTQRISERDPLRSIGNQMATEQSIASSKCTPESTVVHANQADDQYSPVFLFNAVPETGKIDLDLKLAKAIYVTGAPFAMVEHPLWKEFFNHLQPSYKLPTRKYISTTLLEKTYKDTRQEVTAELMSAPNLHLQCDGWSNVRNEGIINFLISKPEPMFVEFVNTECNRHTSDYICEEIIKIMKQYGEKTFYVLIGDNAKNMQLALKKVQMRYPHVVPLGCVAHALNLLCQDYLKYDSLNNFICLATEIIKTIKQSQILSALYEKIVKEKKSGQQLKLPCKTRWGSNANSLKSLQKFKLPLQALAVHEKSILNNETKSMILQEGFWTKVDDSLSILEPITKWIFEIESNDCNINKVSKLFSEIESSIITSPVLEHSEKENLLAKLNQRKEFCVKPIHLAADMLDPKSQGHRLNTADEIMAMEFIHQTACHLNLNVMSELAYYRSKEGPLWGKSFVWACTAEVDLIAWWKGICSSSSLSKVAIRILTAPTTSAATERSFSMFSLIHNKQRNRLTTERAGKVTYIAYNWNLQNKKVSPLACEETDNTDEDQAAPFYEERDDTDEDQAAPLYEERDDTDEDQAAPLYEEHKDTNEPRAGPSQYNSGQEKPFLIRDFSVDSESD